MPEKLEREPGYLTLRQECDFAAYWLYRKVAFVGHVIVSTMSEGNAARRAERERKAATEAVPPHKRLKQQPDWGLQAHIALKGDAPLRPRMISDKDMRYNPFEPRKRQMPLPEPVLFDDLAEPPLDHEVN